MPSKFLVILATGAGNCACFGASLPHVAPEVHFEAIGNAYSGAYCFTGTSGAPFVLGFNANMWGNDGPGCGGAATLIDFGTAASLALQISFATGICVQVSLIGFTNTGNEVALFSGAGNFSDCAGPWVVNNEAPGCSYEMLTAGIPAAACPAFGFDFPVGVPLLSAGSGGTATVYPCGC